ncbi:MAG: hypothetical protein K2M97_08300 [Muribaculaceae bacterium]|nr:hypothetical protein [Muribaculaceae bacterium]
MNNITMTSMRDASLSAALRRQYHRARLAGLRLTDDEILRRAISSSVPDGYFVGLDHALKMVSAAIHHRLPSRLKPLRRLMWDEIAAKTTDRMRLTGERMIDSVTHVLSSSAASRYFISETSARRITRHIRRKEAAL